MPLFAMVNGSLLGTKPTELTLSLRMSEMAELWNGFDGREVPDTEEVDLDFYGKGIPESAALFPPYFVFACVHFICERNLLLIVRRKEPDLRVQE